MKKKIFICIAILFILLSGLIVKMKLTRYEAVDASIDLINIEDGIYFGAHKNKVVYVEVEVTVKDNKISDINIIKHDCGLGKKAEAIIEPIIQEQSLDVDGISGATMSSNVIKLAVEEALR